MQTETGGVGKTPCLDAGRLAVEAVGAHVNGDELDALFDDGYDSDSRWLEFNGSDDDGGDDDGDDLTDAPAGPAQ